MTQTIARTKVGSNHYEIVVDMEEALKIKKEEAGANISAALLMNEIFNNSKDGEKPSNSDLEKDFGTTDTMKIAERIIKKGEIQVTQEYRDEGKEKKKKQIVDWYVRNAVDAKTDRPFTPETVSDALDNAGVNIGNGPIDAQISGITIALSKVLPLKVETKKLLISIPAIHTGKTYGIVNEYKEKEDWLSNGDLQITVNIPVGLQSEFYDKLNAVTHGSAITQEIKQKTEETTEE